MRIHWKQFALALAVTSVVACAGSSPPPGSAEGRTDSVQPARYQELHKKYLGGVNLFKKGAYAGALRNFSEVWNWDSGYLNVAMYLSDSYLFLGLEHYGSRRYADAIEMWKKALAVNPGNHKAERYLQRVQEEERKFEKLDG